MPTKVLAVFGSPGSGKTTLSLMLGYILGTQGKNVTLISVDRTVPQAKAIFPLSEGGREQSLGALLLSEITERAVAESLLLHPDMPRLSLLSFQSGETETMYPPTVDKERYRSMLGILYRLSDYLIIDCTANPLTNSLTLASLELADRVIALHTPDHIGVEWRSSTYSLLRDNRFRTEEHLTVLSPCHSNSPVSELQKLLSPFTSLPFSQEVSSHRISGAVLTKAKAKTNTGFQYMNAVKAILNEVTVDAGQ